MSESFKLPIESHDFYNSWARPERSDRNCTDKQVDEGMSTTDDDGTPRNINATKYKPVSKKDLVCRKLCGE